MALKKVLRPGDVVAAIGQKTLLLMVVLLFASIELEGETMKKEILARFWTSLPKRTGMDVRSSTPMSSGAAVLLLASTPLLAWI